MTLYLDTSAVVSIFVTEDRTADVTRLVGDARDSIIISDLVSGEFGAAISTAVRMNRLSAPEGEATLGDFDSWCEKSVDRLMMTGADLRLGTSYARRFDLALLFPDALHLALCRRANAMLVTGDRRQASAAHIIGMTVTLL